MSTFTRFLKTFRRLPQRFVDCSVSVAYIFVFYFFFDYPLRLSYMAYATCDNRIMQISVSPPIAGHTQKETAPSDRENGRKNVHVDYFAWQSVDKNTVR